MSVKQWGGAWQVYVVMPDGKRIREGFKTQVDAIKREAELKMAAATGKVISAADRSDRRLTLGDLYERTCGRVWKGAKAERSLVNNGKLVVRYFGAARRVSEIDTRAVNDFALDLEKMGNSNASINRKVAALSRMLSLAHEEGYLSDKPKIKRRREGGGRIRFMSDREEAAMLATLRVWGLKGGENLFTFLLDTGARVSEALRLEWSDVNHAQKRVTFWDTKNNTPRSVPMTGRVQEIMGNIALGRPFPYDYDEVHRWWDRLRTHLGMGEDKQFVLHMLRHTCASRLVQRGASIVKVKEWLGHKTITVTMRYSHLAPTSLDDLVTLLDRPVEGSHLRVVEGS